MEDVIARNFGAVVALGEIVLYDEQNQGDILSIGVH